jgi:large subunit ribosomal protein L6
MSRIGKQPISVPSKVKVTVSNGKVSVDGPEGKLTQTFRSEAKIVYSDSDKRVVVERNGETAFARAYHGTTRALIANMINGASKGFKRNLDIIGVGYNAKVQGKKVVLQIGFCHPVEIPIPEGLKVETPKPVRIEIVGADKQVVGEFAATVRRVRPPEPYKGKGIRYENEHVVRKAGKAFGSGA